MPRGECLVRLRGENWKLRVPLLQPVPRDEQLAIAEQYDLGEVLAGLRERASAADREDRESASQDDAVEGRTAYRAGSRGVVAGRLIAVRGRTGGSG